MLSPLLFVVGLSCNSLALRAVNFVYSFDNVVLTDYHTEDPNCDKYSIISYTGKSYNVKKFIGVDNPYLIPDDIANYNSTVQLTESTLYYNCHSFAWLYDGNLDCVPNSTDNLYILNNPYNLYNSSPYQDCATYNHYANPSAITDMSLINVGDIVVYYEVGYPVVKERIHSAVVTSVGNTISNVTVISKWGNYPVYQHLIFDCMYYCPPVPVSAETHIDICHVNHSYSFKNSNAYYHFYETSCCGKTKRSPHNFIQSGFRYVCSVCGYASFDPYKGGVEE